MVIAYKYNIECKEKPNTGKTWMVFRNADQTKDDMFFTDHIEFRGVPLWTSEKADGFGFCIMTEGKIKKKVHPATGKPYTLIVPDNEEIPKFPEGKVLRGVKYHVPSRGLMQDNTWRIYMDIKNGVAETEYVDHIEYLNVPSYTGEASYRIGFSQLSEGDVTFDYDPETGKRFAVIHNGSYQARYTKDAGGRIVEANSNE